MGIAWLEDLRVDLMHEVFMQATGGTLHVTPSYVCCHPLAKLESTFKYLGRMLCSVAGQGRQWGFWLMLLSIGLGCWTQDEGLWLVNWQMSEPSQHTRCASGWCTCYHWKGH